MINRRESSDTESVVKAFEQRYGRVFRLPDSDRESLSAYNDLLMEYRPQATTSFQALGRLNKHTGQRVDKLRAAKSDLSIEYDQIAMIQNTSFLYISLYEIGQKNGWSKEQIAEAFEAQLKFYNEISVAAKELVRRRIKGFSISNNRQAVAARDRLAKRKPDWYQNDLKSWLNFMHDEFSIQSDIRSRLVADICPTSIGQSDRTYRVTAENLVPEWLSDTRRDDQGEMPTLETVENDVVEDEYAKKRLVDEFLYLESKCEHLAQLAADRGRKTIERNTRRMRDLLPVPSNLPQLLMFMADTDGVVYYNLDPDRISAMTPAEINSTALAGESKEEWLIRRFAQNAEMSEELLRVYLKKKFDELKIFEVSTEQRIRLVGALLAGADKTELMALRNEDKKAFQTINFDLRPMLGSVPDEVMQDLQSRLVDNPFVSQDQLIGQLSSTIVDYFWSTSQSREVIKLKEEYRKFSINWLKNNWREAYAGLYVHLHRKAAFQSETEENEEGKSLSVEVVSQTAEIETEIREAKIGGLAGWQILFDVNKNGDPHMEELSGESLDDIEAQLEDVLLKHRISCSIKLSSVVNTLEWITTLPKEVVQVMIRETINGLDYLKIKRGNVRLFFQIDNEKKQLRFFVYQKQSLEYHF